MILRTFNLLENITNNYIKLSEQGKNIKRKTVRQTTIKYVYCLLNTNSSDNIIWKCRTHIHNQIEGKTI